MKYPTYYINSIGLGSSGNINSFKCYFLAVVIASTYIATTDKTSKSIRLNSSKQPHNPD